MLGILQLIRDAAKLFLKEFTHPPIGNNPLFSASPPRFVLSSLNLGFISPKVRRDSTLHGGYSNSGYSRIWLLSAISQGVSIYRKYTMVRSLRGIVQIVSYKIRLALIVFRVPLLSKSLSVGVLSKMTGRYLSLLVCPFLLIL